jgi:hypothetical protein
MWQVRFVDTAGLYFATRQYDAARHHAPLRIG